MSVSGGIDRFFRQVFSSMTVEGPKLDAQEFQRQPHMIVCTHRSHVDYYMAGYTLIFRGFKHLRFAAGSNLTRLPYLGPRFRAFGAFTVEREIAFERDYVKKLCNRVVAMMKNKEAVIVFPEGGRSYSGATLDVKSGILGAAVLLQARRPMENVVLLPMAISYECAPDAPWFGLLLKGKKLRKHTQPFLKRMLGNVFYFGADILAFAPFMLAPRTGRKYGAVYIDYDAPVSARSFLDQETNNATEVSDDFFKYRVAMRKLGEHMRGKFIALYRLLPHHLLASVMRDIPALPRAQAEKLLPAVLEILRGAGRNLKSVEPCTPAEITDRGLGQLLRMKAISLRNGVLSVQNKRIIDYCAAPVFDGRAPAAPVK